MYIEHIMSVFFREGQGIIQVRHSPLLPILMCIFM